MWDVLLIIPLQRAHLLVAFKERHLPASSWVTPLATHALAKLGADTSNPCHSTNSCKEKTAALGGPPALLCLSVGSFLSQDNGISETAWKTQPEEAQHLSTSLPCLSSPSRFALGRSYRMWHKQPLLGCPPGRAAAPGQLTG